MGFGGWIKARLKKLDCGKYLTKHFFIYYRMVKEEGVGERK
jgi:hypothetical protein